MLDMVSGKDSRFHDKYGTVMAVVDWSRLYLSFANSASIMIPCAATVLVILMGVAGGVSKTTKALLAEVAPPTILIIPPLFSTTCAFRPKMPKQQISDPI